MFDSDRWSTNELKELLKELERMYLGNIRQSTFKDQTLIFKSDADLSKKIRQVQDELNKRSGTTTAGKKKKILMTSRSKGF